jgi:bacterioferritin
MADSAREQKRKKVIDVLNTAREMELHAISQYMNQHYGLDDMDYGELAKNVKLVAIDEMRHAEMFAERIKELGGEPVGSASEKVSRGQEVGTIFAHDSKLEDDTIDAYNQFLQVCRENGDSITAKLFEQIIEEEQDHLNYFDDVGDHIENLGSTYLARIAGTSASTGGFSKGFITGSGEE